MKSKKKYIITAITAVLLACLVTLAVLLVPKFTAVFSESESEQPPTVTGPLSDLIPEEGVVKIECIRRYYRNGDHNSDDGKAYELNESKWQDFFEKTRNTEYSQINSVIKGIGQYVYTVSYEDGTYIFFDLFYCKNSSKEGRTEFLSTIKENKFYELFDFDTASYSESEFEQPPTVTGTLSDLIPEEGVVKVECLRRFDIINQNYYVDGKTYELDESKWQDIFKKTRNTEYTQIDDKRKGIDSHVYTVYYEDGTQISFDQCQCYDIDEKVRVDFFSTVLEDEYYRLFDFDKQD